MSTYPNNFQWVGDVLNWDNGPDTVGVWIDFKNDSMSNWITLIKSETSTPNSWPLPSSYGPNGTVRAYKKTGSGGGGWGTPNEYQITNTNT